MAGFFFRRFLKKSRNLRERKLVSQGSLYFAHVAQSVEHFLGKEEVIGSNPIVGSRESKKMAMLSEKKEGLSHVEAEV